MNGWVFLSTSFTIVYQPEIKIIIMIIAATTTTTIIITVMIITIIITDFSKIFILHYFTSFVVSSNLSYFFCFNFYLHTIFLLTHYSQVLLFYTP